MKLAVVGLGLVSPVGLSSAEHVFFVRAGVPPPQPSPFVLAGGDPARVAFCPWIGARASLTTRLGELALAALREAMAPLEGVEGLGPAQLFVCTPSSRAGLREADRVHVEGLVARRLGRGVTPTRLSDEAAAFAALQQSAAILAEGSPRAAVIVAVDSFVSATCLAGLLARPPSPWAEQPPPPAEGAAALVVMDPAVAGRLRLPVLGHVLGASTIRGTSTDDDDEIVDGVAMTRLLRAAPLAAPLGAVFGQLEVDALRQTEWLLAATRSAARLEAEHESRCVEGEIGALGAASGLMSLAYGFAFLRHGAARSAQTARAPFAAWAISRDGTRGLAVSVCNEAQRELASPQRASLLVAMRDRPSARLIPDARFTAPQHEEEAEDEDPFAGDDDSPDMDEIHARPDNDVALEAALDALEQEALIALAGSEDEPLANFTEAKPPPLRLAASGGEPVPLARFYAEIIDTCVDTIASLARDRALRPARERPSAEARILEQIDAILITGPGCIDELSRALGRSFASKDPWQSWAPVFALGSIEGGESLHALDAGLSALPQDARAFGRVAAEALALAPHPELGRLAAQLMTSPNPLTRAIGVDLRSRRGELPPEAIAAHLQDASAPVLEAALRALGRLAGPEPDLVPALRQQMRFPDAAVAWQATRILLLWGHDDPYFAAREGEIAGLGAEALEIFVLRGEAGDLPRMEAWLSRAPVTPAVLSAIARFGHVGAWAFLVHHLADDDLSDAAADALETLFGARVPMAERKLPRAWRAAIAAARFDPGLRYRRGEPWRPDLVVAEWTGGALPRGEIARRTDELITRTRAGTAVELAGWTPEPEMALEALGAAACSALRAVPAGRWS